jgi:hypothetical protein
MVPSARPEKLVVKLPVNVEELLRQVTPRSYPAK